MEDAITCAICAERYTEKLKIPRVLKCGHTFCSCCLESITKSSLNQNSLFLICPIDKKLGHNSLIVAEIPINRVLLDIVIRNDDNTLNLDSLSLQNKSDKTRVKFVNDNLEKTIIKLNNMHSIYSNCLNTLNSNITQFIDNKNYSINKIIYNYDKIISTLNNRKFELVNQLETYCKEKVVFLNNFAKFMSDRLNIIRDSSKRLNLLINNNTSKNYVSEYSNIYDQLIYLKESYSDDLISEEGYIINYLISLFNSLDSNYIDNNKEFCNFIKEYTKNISNLREFDLNNKFNSNNYKSFISKYLFENIGLSSNANLMDKEKFDLDIYINDICHPKLFIKSNILNTATRLVNSIFIEYKSNENFNKECSSYKISNINNKLSNSFSIFNNKKLEDVSLIETQLSNINVKDNENEYFLWFQQNSSNIYIKEIDKDIFKQSNEETKFMYNQNQWKLFSAKNPYILPEMFRVCKINKTTFSITGGCITNKNEFNSNSKESKTLNLSLMFKDDFFLETSALNIGRKAHSSIFHNGYVYVCGGLDNFNNYISSCEKFNYKNQDNWTFTSNMNVNKSHSSLCSFNNKYIYSFGGENNKEILKCIEVYSSELDIWKLLDISLNYGIECLAAININNETILLVGGYSEKGFVDDLFLFNYEIDLNFFNCNDENIIDNKISTLINNNNKNNYINKQFIKKCDFNLEQPGWSIYEPIVFKTSKINLCDNNANNLYIVNLFLGGEEESPPYYMPFEAEI